MESINWKVQTEAAVEYLKSRIRETPLEYSPSLTELLSVPVYLKLEFLQITGSFKLRGALWKMASLPEEQRRLGVITCSAGNHGWAVAYAGRKLSVPVTVYLPASVDPSKRAGIKALGAQTVVTRFPGFDETEEFALVQADQQGLPYISAFDDFDVMAANGGTLAWEVLSQLPTARSFAVPVGGGGLAAGLSAYLSASDRMFELYGCQLGASPALKLSLEQGTAVTRLPAVETFAGGLEGGIGKLSFSVLRDHVTDVVLLDETDLREAVCWLIEQHHYVAEVSAVAGLAACLSGRLIPRDGPLVIVITGRNISAPRLRQILVANLTAAD
jgi:threonine dehydratase